MENELIKIVEYIKLKYNLDVIYYYIKSETNVNEYLDLIQFRFISKDRKFDKCTWFRDFDFDNQAGIKSMFIIDTLLHDLDKKFKGIKRLEKLKEKRDE